MAFKAIQVRNGTLRSGGVADYLRDKLNPKGLSPKLEGTYFQQFRAALYEPRVDMNMKNYPQGWAAAIVRAVEAGDNLMVSLASRVTAKLRALRVRPGRSAVRRRRHGSVTPTHLAEAMAGNTRVFERKRRVAGENPPGVHILFDRSISMRKVTPQAITLAGALMQGADRAGSATSFGTFGSTTPSRTIYEAIKAPNEPWSSKLPVSQQVAWMVEASIDEDGTEMSSGIAHWLAHMTDGVAESGDLLVIVTDDTCDPDKNLWRDVAKYIEDMGLQLVFVSIAEADSREDVESAGARFVHAPEPGVATVNDIIEHVCSKRGAA